MALNSMTGFGRSSGDSAAWSWVWEVRSVNGRGLDLRVRLPSHFDTLDQRVRKAIQSRLKRGSVTVTFNVTRQAEAMNVKVNEAVLQDVIKVVDRVREATDAAPPRVDGLLALKGVLDVVECSEDDAAQQALEAKMFEDFEAAFDELIRARHAEGVRLTEIVRAKISEISALVTKIETSPSRSASAIQQRLNEQISRLLESSNALDETRLHQEAVLLATRADVEEEVKRLSAHATAANALLDSTKPIGRQLDFLAQEFNREANTICSKAGANDISQAGLALKTAIDQLREQVQNIE